MTRRTGSLVVILLLAVPLAWNQERPVGSTRSQQLSEPLISTARLRVPRQARELYEKATKRFRNQDYIAAREKLDQALHLFPAFPEALTLLGYIQLNRNEWEAAEKTLQSAIRTDPSFGLAYLALSRLYRMQERFDDAIEVAQRAKTLMPGDWLVSYEICSSLMKKHQYATVVNLSDAALLTNRGTLLHVAKAHALIGLGRYQEAIVELRTYLYYQPAGEGSQDAHHLLDMVQSATNQGTP